MLTQKHSMKNVILGASDLSGRIFIMEENKTKTIKLSDFEVERAKGIEMPDYDKMPKVDIYDEERNKKLFERFTSHTDEEDK